MSNLPSVDFSIILTGIKHCGKSTQGKLIASYLDLPFFDTDDIIEQQTSLSVRELYTTKGENEFKKAEEQACRSLLEKYDVESKGSKAVIATGGGICNNPGAMEILHKIGKLVFLLADETLSANRIINKAKINLDGTITDIPAYIVKKSPRSISEVRDIFHQVYTQRIELYSSSADIIVNIQNASKEVNMLNIIKALSD